MCEDHGVLYYQNYYSIDAYHLFLGVADWWSFSQLPLGGPNTHLQRVRLYGCILSETSF